MISSFRIRAHWVILVIFLIGLISLQTFYLPPKNNLSLGKDTVQDLESDFILTDPLLNSGGVIMPQLGNATAKAELGRATWKLIHTMAARYPLKPKEDERAAVKQWIILLSRLYPCGECAEHFQKMLKQHPPQTSSRASLSNWACAVHNIVNERLGKPEFDCSTLADVYKCGCADEPKMNDDILT